MKIVISESQHSRLLNLLNEGPVPAAVARRLNQLRELYLEIEPRIRTKPVD